ncbi:MAG: 50S ribosomal protein L23 [Brevinematales bacterium]|jgi:large subunit ribosomal protein L23|nr:50S ribosomal protein L23 [Brevinematales bacterium]OHD56771.1 MAG: 50S ribosomal protein L23 [Spirochaetes bacterium GWF1_49_6]
MSLASEILIRPVITEKVSDMNADEKKSGKGKGKKDVHKKYAFEVSKDANKIEITRAVEQLFKVEVDKVNTILVKPKRKRLRNQKVPGYTNTWKKAIVTLKKGEIDVFKA